MADLAGEVYLTMEFRETRSGYRQRLVVVKHSNTMPTLGPAQRAIRLRFTVPAVLFNEPPVPTVEIEIDPDRIAVGRATVEVLEPVTGEPVLAET